MLLSDGLLAFRSIPEQQISSLLLTYHRWRHTLTTYHYDTQSDYTFSQLTMPSDLHENKPIPTPTFLDCTAYRTSVKTLYWASWRTGQQPQPWEEWGRLFLQTLTK